MKHPLFYLPDFVLPSAFFAPQLFSLQLQDRIPGSALPKEASLWAPYPHHREPSAFRLFPQHNLRPGTRTSASSYTLPLSLQAVRAALPVPSDSPSSSCKFSCLSPFKALYLVPLRCTIHHSERLISQRISGVLLNFYLLDNVHPAPRHMTASVLCI